MFATMAYTLRPYQSAAVASAWNYLRTQAGNPCIVLPTGSGKSLCVAQLCADALGWGGKVLVVQHRKELICQNAEKIRALIPNTDLGIYSAGLNKRHTEHDIICCGIQSVFKRAYDFGQRNVVIIDENHLVPHDGEGMYRKFLDDLRSANERLRIIGLTATPFRLDCGPLCRPDGIFQKVCYSAPIRELIDAGYLCRLTTQPSATQIDTGNLHLRGGEFIASEAESLFDRATEAACAEIVKATGDRRSVLVFCSGVNHAQHVASMLEKLTGESCGIVTGSTIPLERAATLDAFGARRLRFLTNCDVLTTGYDAPCIDAIAILRATMSPGLYAQICGRGFRLFAGKENCSILDFGGNILRHGPLDAIDYGRQKDAKVAGEAPTKICPNCESELLIQTKECPECGYCFPIERKPVDTTASDAPILSEPETWDVEDVVYSVHHKKKDPSATPTLRVDYVVSANGRPRPMPVMEFICLEHDGYALSKARKWWAARSIVPVPDSVAEAEDLAKRGALAWPRRITIRREGKWERVVSADLEDKPAEWLDEVLVEEDMPF